MTDDRCDRILRFLVHALGTPQREVLVAVMDWTRRERLHGMPARANGHMFEGDKPQAVRALIKSGYLTAHSPYSRFPVIRLTEVGLLVAEQLYADMGLDANVLYQSETSHPASPDIRPLGRMTADPVTFVDDLFKEYAGSTVRWTCLLCDDGERFTDRAAHWAWHMRLAATVDAIDWGNPVVTPEPSAKE